MTCPVSYKQVLLNACTCLSTQITIVHVCLICFGTNGTSQRARLCLKCKLQVFAKYMYLHLGLTLLVRTLFINPRHACAARVTVVILCVCVCKSHLTSGASTRPENAITYSAGIEDQKICGVFSETAPLQRSGIPSDDSNTYRRPIS